jgi:hypothetical protein
VQSERRERRESTEEPDQDYGPRGMIHSESLLEEIEEQSNKKTTDEVNDKRASWKIFAVSFSDHIRHPVPTQRADEPGQANQK